MTGNDTPLTAPGILPEPFEWVKIPAGPFLMGSKKDMADQAFDDEEPQHQLDLPAYKIGKYPVTVWQFERFVEATLGQEVIEAGG